LRAATTSCGTRTAEALPCPFIPAATSPRELRNILADADITVEELQRLLCRLPRAQSAKRDPRALSWRAGQPLICAGIG